MTGFSVVCQRPLVCDAASPFVTEPPIRETGPRVSRSAVGTPGVRGLTACPPWDPRPCSGARWRGALRPRCLARGSPPPGPRGSPPRASPAPQMPAIAVLAAAAAAWCFLQVESRHPDALAGGAGPNHGNFLDNDQWLSTVSQYDRDKYWNRFRDVSTAAARPAGAGSAPEAGCGGDRCTPPAAAWGSGARAASCLRGTLKRTSKA